MDETVDVVVNLLGSSRFSRGFFYFTYSYRNSSLRLQKYREKSVVVVRKRRGKELMW
jgi:hypothetical protein